MISTPQEALAAAYEWVRESNRRGGVGDAHLREMLGVLGLDNLLDDRPRATAGPTTPRASCSSAGRRPARRATSPRPTDCATELAALGWQVRDAPGGAELVRAER